MRKVIARWGTPGKNSLVLRLTERMKDVGAWTLWRDTARNHFVSMDWSHLQVSNPNIDRGAEDDYCIHVKLRMGVHPSHLALCLSELEAAWRKANLIGPGAGQFNMFDTEELGLPALADEAQERAERNSAAAALVPLVHQPVAITSGGQRTNSHDYPLPVEALTPKTPSITTPISGEPEFPSIVDLRELASPNLVTAKKAYDRIQGQVAKMTTDGNALVEKGKALIAAGVRYAHVLEAAREYAEGYVK